MLTFGQSVLSTDLYYFYPDAVPPICFQFLSSPLISLLVFIQKWW